MKHQFTNDQLSAAIVAAYNKANAESRQSWDEEVQGTCPLNCASLTRVAEYFLTNLPEPPPPVVDGKTPGQVYQEVLHALDPDRFYAWSEIRPTLKQEIERGASAVLAAFGNKPAESKIEAPAEVIHDGGEVFEKVEAVDPYAELKAAHATGKVIQIIIGTTWRDIPAGTHVVWDTPADEYRIKPTPSTFTAHGKEWTPAVGDVVTLKSGGPKMTVENIKQENVFCRWFDMNGSNQLLFNVATLTKAD